MGIGKNRTFEKSGGTRKFEKKNMKFEKTRNRTSEKFWGTRTFGTNMVSGKGGHKQKAGVPRIFRKNMQTLKNRKFGGARKFRKIVILRQKGIFGNFG